MSEILLMLGTWCWWGFNDKDPCGQAYCFINFNFFALFTLKKHLSIACNQEVNIKVQKITFFKVFNRTQIISNQLPLHQGCRTWQLFVGSKNGNENFRQVRIYNFRIKCVVFAGNRKFAKLTQ